MLFNNYQINTESIDDSDQKSNILFIGAGPIWTKSAGYLVRQSILLEAAQKISNVTVAIFEMTPGEINDVYNHFPNAIVLPRPLKKKPSKLKLFFYDYVSSLPRVYRGLKDIGAKPLLAKLDPEHYDLILAYRIDHAYWAGVLGYSQLLLDIDDPEHVRIHRRIGQQESSCDKRTLSDLLKLKTFEQNAVARAKIAFLCQKGDASYFKEGNISILPNAVEVPVSPLGSNGKEVILFIGNLSGDMGTPNSDAVVWFINAIWPHIINKNPNVVFRVVGKTCVNMFQFLKDRENVEILGYADNLAHVFENASISIAPIRYGTGTRIKILDTLAHKCPIVSTTIGADGLDTVHEKHLLISNEPRDFARQCLRLINYKVFAQQIANQGYDFVKNNYDREIIINHLSKTMLESLTAKK